MATSTIPSGNISEKSMLDTVTETIFGEDINCTDIQDKIQSVQDTSGKLTDASAKARALQTPIILIDMYSYSSEKFSYGGGITLAFIMVGFDLFLMFKEGQNTANKYGEKPNTLATS